MVVLDKEHVLSVVRTIYAQLIGTTSSDIIGSWGVSKFYATQIVKTLDEVEVSMAALVMQVNGFQFRGTVMLLSMKEVTIIAYMVNRMVFQKNTTLMCRLMN